MHVKIGAFQTNDVDRIRFFKTSGIQILSSSEELRNTTCHLYLLHSSESDDVSFLYRDEPWKNLWKISYSGGLSQSQAIFEDQKMKVWSVTFNMLQKLLPSFIELIKQKPDNSSITKEDLLRLFNYNNELEQKLQYMYAKRSDFKGEFFKTPYENALSKDLIELNKWISEQKKEK